jgi:predicted Zn finger-like uncharacterized protein
MSLLTRCPACVTLYRVVPDQLRISDGWVKCGQCGEIFDASKDLIEEVRDPEPDTGMPGDAVPSLTAPRQEDFEDTQLVTAPIEASKDEAEDQGTFDDGQDAYRSDEPAVDHEAILDVDLSAETDSVDEPNAPVPVDIPNDVTVGEEAADDVLAPDKMAVRWDDETVAPATSPDSVEPTAPDDIPVTFLKTARPPSIWQKPVARRVLMLLAGVLGFLLVGQWVYVERDQLAAKHPELKPMLQAVCGVANCQVQALRRIESLSVDSVGFHLLGKDTYRLSFAIKNSSLWPLATPSVELALTDTQDQPVYRRVFSTKDLVGAQAEIAAGAEWPVVVALRVNSATPEQRVLGYRLMILYP